MLSRIAGTFDWHKVSVTSVLGLVSKVPGWESASLLKPILEKAVDFARPREPHFFFVDLKTHLADPY